LCRTSGGYEAAKLSSTTAAIPAFSVASARASVAARRSGATPVAGPMATSAAVRAAWRSAKVIAMPPPTAQPAIATGSVTPSASSRAAMSSAIVSMLTGAESFSDCPAPRVSNRSTRRCADSAGSTWSQLSSVPPISCTSTSTRGPAPAIS